MKRLKILFQNNLEWVKSRTENNPQYFQKMAEAQDPNYLWIGCADSRVPANEIVGLEPGELFVHRNVANLFPHTDFNCLSVLQYAVEFLKIQHVIVCGHYGCGGVKAAMEDHNMGLADNWLRYIRDVHSRFKKELELATDPKKRYDRLAELNVLQSVQNICHTTIVQEVWLRQQPLWIHGWIYDLASGYLKDLECCISSIDQVESIYRVRSE